MSRREFSMKTKKAAYERSGGICECGCGRPFGDHPKERPHYDHAIADMLGGTNDLENCQVFRVECHDAKTYGQDIPRIVKVRREDKRRKNISAPKRKIPGSRGSGMRKKMDGSVEWVKE